jgi:hypothetical protein
MMPRYSVEMTIVAYNPDRASISTLLFDNVTAEPEFASMLMREF